MKSFLKYTSVIFVILGTVFKKTESFSVGLVLLQNGTENSVNFLKIEPSDSSGGLSSIQDFEALVDEQTSISSRGAREEPDKTLISFLQESVKKYGEKKVASSIHELAQRSMYDLVWLLAGDLELWLISDLYKMYSVANADPEVLSVYERFQSGKINRTIVPEVFALDKRYNEYPWWRRVRSRMLDSVDKYIAGTLKVNSTPPKIEFGADGKPIIAGKPESVVAAVVEQSTVKATPVVTTVDPDDEDPDDPDDPEDSDLLELLGNFG